MRRSSVQTERDLFELEYSPSTETFRFMGKCSISTRVGMIGLRLLRDDISNDIDNMRIWGYRMCRVRYYRRIPRALIITLVQNKLAHYETEYHKLMEATTGISWHCGRTK